MRALLFVAFGCLCGLIVYTVDLKIRTRALEATERDLVSQMQDESDLLALMRAELSYLLRPARLAAAAEQSLKLKPVEPAQVVPWSTILTTSNPQAAVSSRSAANDKFAPLLQEAASPKRAPKLN